MHGMQGGEQVCSSDNRYCTGVMYKMNFKGKHNHYNEEGDHQQGDTHAYTLNIQSHLMHVTCHAVQVHARGDHREES